MSYADALRSLRGEVSSAQNAARLACDPRVSGLVARLDRLENELRELGAPDLRAAEAHDELLATMERLQAELSDLERGRTRTLGSADRVRTLLRDVERFVLPRVHFPARV
jgi:chromosome segregation ATPase